MKILILGVSGMLGYTLFRSLSANPDLQVWGSARSTKVAPFLTPNMGQHLVQGLDVTNPDALIDVMARLRPDVVLNGTGIVKQQATADDPAVVLPINTLFPHRMAKLCALTGARFITFGTDCVFDGTKGNYRETDPADATDLYGRSKLMGEITEGSALTLRAPFIGDELSTHISLVNWFLAQKNGVKGFRRAIYSGLPTVELARVLQDYVLPNPNLTGLYHIASKPINKYDLLTLIGQTYGHLIPITPDDSLVIDRSLNADRFTAATGYTAPDWPELVAKMHTFHTEMRHV